MPDESESKGSENITERRTTTAPRDSPFQREESAFLSHKKKTQTSRKSAGGKGEPSRSLKGPNGMVAWPEHACGPGPTAETAFQVLSSSSRLGQATPTRPAVPPAGWMALLPRLLGRATLSPAYLGVLKIEHEEALHGHGTRTVLGKCQLPSLGSRSRMQCLS